MPDDSFVRAFVQGKSTLPTSSKGFIKNSPGKKEPSDGHVEKALKKSLGIRGATDPFLSDKILKSKALNTDKIDFQLADKEYQLNIDHLRKKYILLNPESKEALDIGTMKRDDTRELPAHTSQQVPKHDQLGDRDVPRPKKHIYPPERISLKFSHIQCIGSGLENLGNTCFMNAVLQCLVHTPPLNNYFNSGQHSHSFGTQGKCMLCLAKELFKNVKQHGPRGVHKEIALFRNLQAYAGSHMRPYQQHDAHEYMLAFIEALQKSCLRMSNIKEKIDAYTAETTVIGQIFTGLMRNQVRCLNCRKISNTFQPFKDIQIDVEGNRTIVEGFQSYMKTETLHGCNAYFCEHCKRKCKALKNFSVEICPNVLIVMLKRYSPVTRLKKVNDLIQYPDKLNLRPYMHKKEGHPVSYNLYGMVNHSGATCDSGHYYAFIKSPNAQWHTMNDSRVYPMDKHQALNSRGVYLLFYLKTEQAKPWGAKQSVKQNDKPQLSSPHSNDVRRLNGHATGNSDNPRKQASATVTSATVNNPSPAPTVISGTKLPVDHKKIEFGLNKKVHASTTLTNAPRIVMKIKNGNVVKDLIVQKQPQVESTVTSSTKSLVPYEEEGSSQTSDSENEISSSQGKTLPLISKEVDQTKTPTKQLNMLAKENLSKKSTPVFKPRVLASPIRKSTNLTLNLGSPVPNHINATGNWRVHDNTLQSPGLASECSSNTSVNSTSDWTVKSAESRERKMFTTNIVGPKVTPNKYGVSTESIKQNSVKIATKLFSDIDTGQEMPKVCVVDAHTEESDQVQKKEIYIGKIPDNLVEKSITETTIHSANVTEIQNVNVSIGNESKQDISNDSHNRKSHKNGDSNNTSCNDEEDKYSDSYSSKKKHKKKKKKKHRIGEEISDDVKKDFKHREDSGESSKDHDTYRSKMYESSTHENSDIGKAHKNKSHKSDTQHVHDSSTSESSHVTHKSRGSGDHKSSNGHHSHHRSSSSDAEYRKKHRRRRDRDDTSEECRHRSSDSDHRKKQKRRHSRDDSSDDQPEPKVKKKDQTDQQYELVEKTKDGEEIIKKTDKWLATNGSGDRKEDVMKVLFGGSSRSFGVKTWGGDKSEIDRQVEREVKQERKRRWSDEYEDQLDTGKVKKIRNSGGQKSSLFENPFQYQQDIRNYQDEKRKKGENYYPIKHSNEKHHDHHRSRHSSQHYYRDRT